MSNKPLQACLKGYKQFREKYHKQDDSIMEMLSDKGQKPEIMVVACCDSRVDPALLFQCHPGDLFVVRNVANIIPPYENDEHHHGTSAALELGVCFLKVKHIIILGHSQCGGLQALLKNDVLPNNDFVDHWVSLAQMQVEKEDIDDYAKLSLSNSYTNCMSFPWIKQRVEDGDLTIHRWFFNIKTAEISAYENELNAYQKLDKAVIEA